ncbi:MAG: hypothetical protein JO006_19990 [Paucibacter sp.]|nr:hypothetical protein [Roseateles sp.]
MRWNKLLSLLFGTGGVAWSVGMAFLPGVQLPSPMRVLELTCAFVALMSVGISVGAWAGRRWALICYRAISWISIALLIFMAFQDVLEIFQATGHFIWYSALQDALLLAMMLPVFGFLLGVLHHPDVRRDFNLDARLV